MVDATSKGVKKSLYKLMMKKKWQMCGNAHGPTTPFAHLLLGVLLGINWVLSPPFVLRNSKEKK